MHHRADRRRYRALARAAGTRDEQPADPGKSADRLTAQALRGPLAEAYDRLSLNVYLPAEPIPADRLLTELAGPPVAPVLDVSVNGRPAQLVRLQARDAADNGWYLQAQLPNGRTFVVQAPAAFMKDQVLAFAAQVTHTP